MRVHADRGEPLGPVLEELRRRRSSGRSGSLRQIAAEFSSFASSPTRQARAGGRRRSSWPKSIDPYRTGLAGRIDDSKIACSRLCRACLVDRTPDHPRARQHRRERAPRDARPGPALDRCARRGDGVRHRRDPGHGRRHGCRRRSRASSSPTSRRRRPGPDSGFPSPGGTSSRAEARSRWTARRARDDGAGAVAGGRVAEGAEGAEEQRTTRVSRRRGGNGQTRSLHGGAEAESATGIRTRMTAVLAIASNISAAALDSSDGARVALYGACATILPD